MLSQTGARLKRESVNLSVTCPGCTGRTKPSPSVPSVLVNIHPSCPQEPRLQRTLVWSFSSVGRESPGRIISLTY